MSMRVSIHAGPVARCKIERVAVEERTGCVKAGCRNFHHIVGNEGSFCFACGSSLGKFEVPGRAEKVNRWSLFGGSEALTSYESGEHRLFVPNVSRGRLREFSFEPECDEFDEAITAQQLVDECAWFEQAFAAEIAELRQVYGAANVVVEWRIFSEVS